MVLVLRKVWWGAGGASLLVHSTFWVAGLAGYGGLNLPILLTVQSVPHKGGGLGCDLGIGLEGGAWMPRRRWKTWGGWPYRTMFPLR
ncbi:hypothetical protein DQT12_21685 [Salmonella enterica subsp. enterica serovar Reading]|nr:hypothetical protein [Salmonella enterica subsp. enterica serovar Reading]